MLFFRSNCVTLDGSRAVYIDFGCRQAALHLNFARRRLGFDLMYLTLAMFSELAPNPLGRGG